jgi:hypothetical protein
MSGSPLASAHLNNSFERVPGVFSSVPENLIQRKSLLTSRNDAQENLAARTAWRQLLDKNGTSPLRSNKVALVSLWSDFVAIRFAYKCHYGMADGCAPSATRRPYLALRADWRYAPLTQRAGPS